MTLTLILALTALAGAQDPHDEPLRKLGTRMSSDGLTGRFAEALQTDTGLKAVRERLDLITTSPASRARHDSHGVYEAYLFETDDVGRFVLRPDRKAELDRVRKRMEASRARFADFGARLDEVAEQFVDDGDLEKVAREEWGDVAWRTCLYNMYISGSINDADLDVAQRVDVRIRRHLVPDPDGKLRIAVPSRGEIAGFMNTLYGRLERAAKHEASLQKILKRSGDEVSEDAVLLACLRLDKALRKDGDDDVVSRMLDLDPAQIRRDGEAAVRAVAEVSPLIDDLVASLSADDVDSIDLKMLLENPRARLVLAAESPSESGSYHYQVNWFFEGVLAKWFDKDGDRLKIRRSIFPNEEALRARGFQTWRVQLKGMQKAFLSTAERCLDPETAELFRDPAALSLLRQEADRVKHTRLNEVRDQALSMFEKLYFTERDDVLVVRAEAEERIESILARAEALRLEAERVGRP